MRFNLILTGLVFGLVGGFFVGQISSAEILRLVDQHATKIVVGCVIAFCLIVVALLLSDRIIKALTAARNTQIGSWFDQLTETLFGLVTIAPEAQTVVKQSLRDALAIYLSWRTRSILFGMLVAIVVVIVGSISTHVTIEQNRKIETQNDLLALQNEAVRIQLLLDEAARFDDFGPRVSTLVTEIAAQASRARLEQREIAESRETQTSDGPIQASYVNLSRDLWENIRSTLNLLEPYPVFDTKALIGDAGKFKGLKVDYLSPERGRILKALLSERVRLDIGGNLNFAYADMRGFTLHTPSEASGYSVIGCDLGRSWLQHTTLDNADIAGANLVSVSLPSGHGLNASETVFYNSEVDLPFQHRSPEQDGRPGPIYLIDSDIRFPWSDDLAGETLSLDNHHFVAFGLRGDNSGCSSFQFVYDQNGNLDPPQISFAGATLTTGGTSDYGNAARQMSYRIFSELAGDADEIVVPFASVVDPMLQLLIPRDQDRTPDLAKALRDANTNVSVRLFAKDINADTVPDYEREFWEGKQGKAFVMEFSRP